MEKNNQLAFDIAEKELGISPIMTGKEMASVGEPDKLSMVMYLTQFYEMFRDSLPSRGKTVGRPPHRPPASPAPHHSLASALSSAPASDPGLANQTCRCGGNKPLSPPPPSQPFSEPAFGKGA